MQASAITQWLLPLALFIIMFGVGMTLGVRDFMRLLRAPVPVVLGLVYQLVLLPLLAFACVHLFALDALAAVGLMVLAFAPGGATSNSLSLLARGDTALSVTLTGLTSLVTPFTLPLMTLVMLDYWALQEGAMDFPVLASIAKMVLVTLLPVGLGMLLSGRWPQLAERVTRPVKLMSLLFMLVVVSAIVVANGDRFGQMLAEVGVAALALACAALAMGYLAAWGAGLDNGRRITLSLETGIQNAGTALMVTSGLLHNPEMSGIVLIYGVLMQAPALLIVCWRNRDLLNLRARQLS